MRQLQWRSWHFGRWCVLIWSAPAEYRGDGAFELIPSRRKRANPKRCRACHRTPNQDTTLRRQQCWFVRP